MSYQAKKAWETRYLEKVKSLYRGFPPGIIRSHEEPDFLVWNGSTNCGLELVQYVRGHGRQGSLIRWREELHDAIVTLAKTKYETRSTIPLSVHFHWFRQRELRRHDADWLSDEICQLVSKYELLEINDSVAFEPDYLTRIRDFVTRISIRRRSAGKNVWSVVEVGPAEADAFELQRVISSKNLKVSSYLRHCTEVWLIVVADGQRVSSSAELNNKDRQRRFESQFKKILYYDGDSEFVTELLS
jgi:hypothetical protein